MDFEPTEEHRIFRDSLRKFLEDKMRPLDERWGDEEITPDHARQFTRMLVPWGYLGGGDGSGDRSSSDPFIECIMTEELARVFPSMAGVAGMTAGAGRTIARRAHPDIARRLAPPLLAGDLIGANAISEPDVGSDPSGIRCRAERRGDNFVINGTKCWISNGHIADVVVVVAQTDPALGPAGVRQFVIDRRESPFESRDIPTIGLKAFPTSELFLEDVTVPLTHQLDGWSESGRPASDPAKSFANVLQMIAGARIGTALISVGIAERAFEIALEYAKIRRQFGKQIAKFQLVQEMIAEMATEIDAARLLCYRAMQLARIRRCDAEVSMAKAFATEMAVRVCSKAMQCMGAHGLAMENRVERCLRDARMLTIPDGTTQIQNLIIGRALTGMSAIR